MMNLLAYTVSPLATARSHIDPVGTVVPWKSMQNFLEDPADDKEYRSLTAEWEAYFASQKYESRNNEWRNAVLEVLAEMNILEDEHKSDPYKAVMAVADEGGRRVLRKRSTD